MNVDIFEVVSVRYESRDHTNEQGPWFATRLHVTSGDGQVCIVLYSRKPIEFLNFPNASPIPPEAASNVSVASDVMAPAPESLPTPVAGGPSMSEPNPCRRPLAGGLSCTKEHGHAGPCKGDPNYDPSPYCSYGHRTKEQCDCGPIAEND